MLSTTSTGSRKWEICMWLFWCLLGIRVHCEQCSDYLVSGWGGIQDKQLLVLNLNKHDTKHGILNPAEGRLYSQRPRSTNDYHPLNTFRYEAWFWSSRTIVAIVIRSDVSLTYHLKTRSPITSYQQLTDDSGETRHFWHVKAETPTTTYFSEPLTTLNGVMLEWVNVSYTPPNIWHFEFDLIGCDNVEGTTIQAVTKAFEFIPATVTDLPPGSVLSENIPDPRACGELCMDDQMCQSFSVDMEGGQCIGYTKSLYNNFHTAGPPEPLDERKVFYYTNTDPSQKLGYVTAKLAGLRYRAYTVKMTHVQAQQHCENDHADLLAVQTMEQMTTLQDMIKGSPFLIHEAPYHVAGSNETSEWLYWGSMDIPGQLWSFSGQMELNVTIHCVAIAPNGLSVIDCDDKRFFFCAY